MASIMRRQTVTVFSCPTSAHGASAAGVNIPEATVDAPAMQKWKGGIVKKLTGGVRALLKANGATLVEGMARFVGPKEVEVTDASGKKTKLTAKKGLVVATGSATIQIPGFKFDGKSSGAHLVEEIEFAVEEVLVA